MRRDVVKGMAMVVGWSLFWYSPGAAWGAPEQAPATHAEATALQKRKPAVLPLKGRYRIEAIERLTEGGEAYYRLTFAELGAPAGHEPRKLTLETYHVHVALTAGMELKLQADMSPSARGQAAVYAADQILVYVKRPQGEVPVWMVSRHNKKLKLKGTSYLKMHDPQSDFLIF